MTALPDITATVTNFDGMDYRSIASVPTDDDKELKRVEEGAGIPTTSIRTQENLVKLQSAAECWSRPMRRSASSDWTSSL